MNETENRRYTTDTESRGDSDRVSKSAVWSKARHRVFIFRDFSS